ncbi:hypothetical protein FACS189461_2160 [Spirochaetia bacterium]|nr:hypothetical protein FACS189461_2160 [Spirochaetia bacterium]
MKKHFVLGLLLCHGVSVFAVDAMQMSMGFMYGSSLDARPHELLSTEGYLGGMGFSFNCFYFWDNKNAGMYFHFSGLLPVAASPKNGISDYDGAQLEAILGPGFRNSLSEKLTFMWAAGFDFLIIGSDYDQNIGGIVKRATSASSNLGIGSDLALQFNFTKYAFFSGGAVFSYHFLNYSTAFYDHSNVGKSWDTNGRFAANVYIAVGFVLHTQNGISVPIKNT